MNHNFERGFILDEIRVRKLHELIASRLDRLDAPPPLLLKVFRGDSFVYETASVDDVVREDNDDWRALTRLDFIAEKENEIALRLSFSPKRTFVNIVGEDRDTVFLLFSDIREYMHSSVLSRFSVNRDTTRLVSMVLMLVAMMGLFWSMLSSLAPNSSEAAKALAATDVGAKLNYLIHQRAELPKPTLGLVWIALMALGTLGSVSGALDWTLRLLFPSNIFLFGQRKDMHERRRSMLSKVFWGVFVAFAVSIVAGILLTWAPSASRAP